MPELAEVEFFRKRWHLAAAGARVSRVLIHGGKRLFRGLDSRAVRAALTGARLVDSEARAKQMLFRFQRAEARLDQPGIGGATRHSGAGIPDLWLGIHLGMSGELSVQAAGYSPGRHDHLVLVMSEARGFRSTAQASGAGASRHPPAGLRSRARSRRPAASVGPEEGCSLVFSDPRMFGRVLFHQGAQPPAWWTSIAPDILSPAFTVHAVAEFLRRRRRAPLKAVLLMQERFPGVGNWMADEILWRAAIHPARAAGSLSPSEVLDLWQECRQVCRQALAAIAGKGAALPVDLNVNIPPTWLFRHRWKRGGRDPRTGTPLAHATIGGRTTCWSPARQPAPAGPRRSRAPGNS